MKKSDEVPRPASCPALPQQQTSSKSQRPLSALEAEWRNRGHGCNSFYTSSLKPLQNIPTLLESERKQPEETTNSVVPPLLALSRTSNTSGESSLWPSSSSNPSSVNPPDFQKLKTRKISFGPRTLYGSSAQSHLFEDKEKGEDHNMTSGNSAVTLPGTQAETDGQLTKDMNTQAGPSMLDPSQKLPKRMSCFLDTENQQPAPKTVRIAPFNRLSNEPPKMSVIDGDKTTICLPHPVSASSVPPAEYPPGTKMNISDGGFVACIPMPGGGKFSPHRLAAHRTNCGCHAHIRAQKILASKDSNEGTKTQPVVIDSDDELEIVMDVPANASTQTKDVPRAIKKEPRQTTVASSQTLNAKQNTATHLSPKQRAKMSADHSKTNPVEAPEKTADDIMSPETVGLSLANIVSRMSKGMLSTRQTDSGSSSESTTSESMPLSPSPSIPAVDTSLFSNPDKLVQMLKEIKRVRPFKRLRVTGRNLFQAAKTGNLEKVIALLVEGCQANNQVESEKGRTALHAAAAGGYLDILKVLRMVGGDVDVLDYDMRTPMFNAVEEHQIQAFEYLSKAGASLRAKDQGGMTLLHVAARRGHTDLISLLLNTGAFDINQKDDGGWTAIMWAAEDKHMATTKLLIDRGGSVHLRDLELNIPLHWAAYAGSEDISLLLLDAHSDVNAINKHGETPLHIATREDNFACVQLFMDRGARIDIANRNAMTPPEVALEGTKSQKLLEVNKMLRLCQPKARYRLLSCDISRGQENVAIPCVNEVDNEPCPDFHFVKESCEVGGSSIQWNIDTIESCSCEGDCRSGLMCQCANHSAHGKIWYTQDGLLSNEIHKLDRPLIFECNRLCKCWSYCRNRVVQKGVQYPLQLFKTKRKGWGVRALCPIPQGVFLCEYTGELISDTEADLRNDDTFLFDLDCKESDQELFCIDALRFGNISRFINHSCEPNCIPTRVFVNHQDIRFPRIAFFSSKDIEIYQEICFDYGDRFWEVKKDEFYCQCGTDSCNYRAPSV